MTTPLRDIVQHRYAGLARRARDGQRAGCGTPAQTAAGACCDPIASRLYDEQEQAGLPAAAVRASLGCGNPTALAALRPGETVLDLGSGGGIDVLLSAARVGPSGRVYGLDMTDEMLTLARENQRQAGVANAEFLKGAIEAIPLPGQSVDVIISNCVINLSADKDAVLREAFRVLRPGGRLALSDIIVRGGVPDEVRRNMELWIGCVAGALEEGDYAARLRAAGFVDVEIEPWRVYRAGDARAFLTGAGLDADRLAADVDGRFASAFIRARKPEGAGRCAPTCCA